MATLKSEMNLNEDLLVLMLSDEASLFKMLL